MSMISRSFGSQSGEPEKSANLLRVGIYARKSNKDEAGRSKSITEQTEFGRNVCEYYGFSEDNLNTYEEEMGQKGDWYWRDPEGRNPAPFRPELTRLMNDIAAGRIDVVVVWRSDRLARDSGVGDGLAKAFRNYGTRLICGGRDLDIDTSSGLYQFSVESANNRRWRDQISEDIIRDKQFKMAMGMFVRDPSCYGLRSKGKKSQAVKPRWDELAVVNRIFKLFVVGEDGRGPMGINAIANLLMDEGISLAVGAKGHRSDHPEKVYTSRIRTILTNCEYIGKFRYNENEYDCKALLLPAQDGSGKMETAVPIALYQAAAEKLKLTDRPGKKSAYSDHLLTGLAICAYCGRPLQVHFELPRYGKKDDARIRAFVCSNRKPPRYCKPYGMKMIHEDELDRWVLAELAPMLVAEMKEVIGSAGRDADANILAELERKVNEATKKEVETLTGMVGVLDREQISLIAGQFRSEREQLQRKCEEIRARLNRQNSMPDLSSDAVAQMPKSTIKDALRRAVQWIAVGREGVVVLTSFGTYIGATFNTIGKGVYRVAGMKTTISPPTPASCLLCLQWLPSPPDFVRGRRDSTGKRSEVLTDDEILPGVFMQDEYLPEVALPEQDAA